MNSYLYGKWRNSPGDGPVEFYSELDPARWELRKVEVLADGRMGLASANRSTHGTQLAIISIPPCRSSRAWRSPTSLANTESLLVSEELRRFAMTRSGLASKRWRSAHRQRTRQCTCRA